MKRKILLLALLILVMGVGAVSAQGGARSYLILATGNSLPAGLTAQVAAAGGTITRVIPQIGVAVAESSNPNFAGQVRGVRSVVPNLVVDWLPGESVFMDVGNPPNSGDDDRRFDLQWGHDVVNAPEAWAAGQRGQGIRVAVLDSGIDADNPDLAPNLNSALSASFVPGEDWNVRPGVFFNHGSHVAGTIGAADNGLGIIGVAPQVELVAVKVLSEYSGSGSFEGVMAGIVYAADINADIINMSLGAVIAKNGDPAEGYTARDAAELEVAMSRATTYAYQHGVAIFASEGNDSIDKDHTGPIITLPADSAHVISISATAPIGWGADPNVFMDNLASYSNYGRSAVDFGAPGGDSAYYYVNPSGVCTVAGITRPCYVFDYVFSTSSGAYYWAAGTSMASPHAAGVAAIILGENGGAMTPSQLQAEMQRRASCGGNTVEYGKGVVNTGY
ncbi:MAG: S8 family serine peptidase [Anaerolineae bacterium]|nr:S8 family serine peptidase [Anaerolineae bacterium]